MSETFTMRSGLQQMVAAFERGKIEHALFTTFNFDPGFFEKNILPILCGLTCEDSDLMKNTEALARDLYYPLKSMKVTVAYDQGVLQGYQGPFRYSLIPMHVKGGFFHPKIIVLMGRDARQKPIATLLVSSGNLTLSGWGSNIEIAAWTPVNRTTARELQGFFDYLRSPALELATAFLKDISAITPSPTLYMQYPGVAEPLFDRVFKPFLGPEIHIFSPFWGKGAIEAFGSSKYVNCYPTKDEKGYHFPIPRESLADSLAVKGIKREEVFRHAKGYFFGTYSAIGSANCTEQALLSSRNVEAMLLFKGAPHPEMIRLGEQLDDWNCDSTFDEGAPSLPLGVWVNALFAERCYSYLVQVTIPCDCRKWKIQIGSLIIQGTGDLEGKIAFSEARGKAETIFHITWDGDKGTNTMMGMIVPIGGSDIELGLRPKRSLDHILQNILRNGVSINEPGSVNLVDPNDFDLPEGEEAEPLPTVPGETFNFDMYGMYQAFFHLRKDIRQAENVNAKNWIYREAEDTLQEICHAIEHEEFRHPLQKWLILQETWDIATLFLDPSCLERYQGLKTELSQHIARVLDQDETLRCKYGIKPKAFLEWIRKELGYES